MASDSIDVMERIAAASTGSSGGGSSNGDLLSFFFMLLWRRSNGAKQHNPLNVRIPDTIVLHHSRPIHWYFTARDGTIKMKSRKNMTTEDIIAFLTKPRKTSSVSGCVSQFVRHRETLPDGVDVSFQSAQDLPAFVSSNTAPGLLQAFIDPKAESGELFNSEIVANWTPNVFYVERRINTSKLGNAHMPLEERCSASETCRFVKTAPLISAHTTRSVEMLCETVARHIDAVFRVRVTNLSLHLKMMADDVPVLLRCSTLRVAELTAPDGTVPRSVAAALESTSSTTTTSTAHKSASSSPALASQGGSPLSQESGAETITSGDYSESRRRQYRPSSEEDDATGHDSINAFDDPSAVPSASVLLMEAQSNPKEFARHISILRRTAPSGASLAPPPATAGTKGAKSATATATATRPGVVTGSCRLCSFEQPMALMSHVQKQHILFPLAVVEFFAAHKVASASASAILASALGDASQDSMDHASPVAVFDESWYPGDPVPGYVRLLHPQMTPEEYGVARNKTSWQNEVISLCKRCADGLHVAAQKIRVDRDGRITSATFESSQRPAPARRRTAAEPSGTKLSRPPVPAATTPEPQAAGRPPLATRASSSADGATRKPPHRVTPLGSRETTPKTATATAAA